MSQAPARQPAVPQPPEPAPKFATFAALGVPNYGFYWVGLCLYVIGYRAEFVTFGWMVWELSRDPLFLGYLGLAQGAPLILFQVFGGVLADRTDRLRLLIGTQSLTAIALTIAFALAAAGVLRVEHLLLLSVLTGIFRAFDEPSRMALVPQLIDRDRLANAVALGSIPWQGGRVLGPSITGLAIAAFGAPVGFALAAIASYGALGLYSRIRLQAGAPIGDGGSVLRQLVEGFAFVGRSFLFASLIGMAFLNSLFGMSYVTLLPIYADLYFAVGSAGYGVMQAAHGGGAVIGTLAIATIAHRLRRRGRIMLVGGAGFGLLLMLFSQSPALSFALVLLVLMGFSNTFYLTLVNTVLQQKVPDQLRGRVMSIFGLCFNLIPLGGVLGGVMAAAVDARFALLVGGAAVAATALLLSLSRRLRAVS
jgi:MFS transporter, DHA1 family, staphyloferrin A biosynthesis exporter